jgi:hypothetical protein
MESDFYTLHDFMVYTKGVVYYLIIAILIGFLGFWSFLTARDDD